MHSQSVAVSFLLLFVAVIGCETYGGLRKKCCCKMDGVAFVIIYCYCQFVVAMYDGFPSFGKFEYVQLLNVFTMAVGGFLTVCRLNIPCSVCRSG
jgi:hypothetical protein